MSRSLRRALIATVLAVNFAGCAAPSFRYSGAIATSERPNARETTDGTVALKDKVVVVTRVAWDASDRKGGVHEVRWNWYEGDTLIVERSRTLEFAKTPFRFVRSIGASDLGIGRYRVEVLIDGVKVDEQTFEVVAN